ncbi:MAG: insulinase family protein [Acetobacter sp.]|nr:insulinase family protein [Acetobacter sp.]
MFYLNSIFMEKFRLSNGASVVYAGNSSEYSVCLSINIGHVNEPRLGLANLFERTLLLQLKGIIPVFGGTMTAYTAVGDDLEEVLEKVSHIFSSAVVTEEYVELAKAAIVKQTLDTAPLTMRRFKLLYKHTAFGADLVRTTDEYLQSVTSCTVEDVRRFANTYYTASNMVVVIAGPKKMTAEIKQLAVRYFGEIPQGEKMPKFDCNIYTGGYGRMDVSDGITRLMFGWDVKHLTPSDSPVANVMMSMFLRRLERAYADAGVKDAGVDFKIAGYYGLRTMRVTVSSRYAGAKELTDIFVKALNRICDTEASESRLEKSRNAAMVEKLDKYEKSDNRALETAWQLIGRGDMYNISNRILGISDTTAHDVKVLARSVFRYARPTYIVAAAPEEQIYSYEELMGLLGLENLLK